MRKRRISMTISESVLERLDSFVDGVHTRSRSEAIENIVGQFLEANRVAVFLAGGDQSKLKIKGVFRPFVKIRGKPLIERNLESLKKAGFKRIYFVGKSQIVGECFKLLGNGEKQGVEMNYIEEKRTLGNAKTLQLVERHVSSPFLVLPIDNLFTFDLNQLVKIHNANPGLATIAIQATREHVYDLGVVEMAGDRILNYEEKPKKPKTFLTSAFIGMYDPRIFDYIPRGEMKWVLQTDLFPKLIKDGNLYGCMISGSSVNIHSEKDLLKAARLAEK